MPLLDRTNLHLTGGIAHRHRNTDPLRFDQSAHPHRRTRTHRIKFSNGRHGLIELRFIFQGAESGHSVLAAEPKFDRCARLRRVKPPGIKPGGANELPLPIGHVGRIIWFHPAKNRTIFDNQNHSQMLGVDQLLTVHIALDRHHPPVKCRQIVNATRGLKRRNRRVLIHDLDAHIGRGQTAVRRYFPFDHHVLSCVQERRISRELDVNSLLIPLDPKNTEPGVIITDPTLDAQRMFVSFFLTRHRPHHRRIGNRGTRCLHRPGHQKGAAKNQQRTQQPGEPAPASEAS